MCATVRQNQMTLNKNVEMNYIPVNDVSLAVAQHPLRGITVVSNPTVQAAI